jgi:hypothetical protein
MKTKVLIALATLTLSAPAAAHDPGCPGPGPGAGPGRGMRGGRAGGPGPGARAYDPKSVTTVAGKVSAVSASGPRGQRVQLDLETADGVLPVRVGPAWFLEKEGLNLAAGDELEVTGSKITRDGQPLLIAQVVKKGATALALRDLNGIPVWAGQGRRR